MNEWIEFATIQENSRYSFQISTDLTIKYRENDPPQNLLLLNFLLKLYPNISRNLE
ncbi:hypothetical protein HZS_198, partial [Henneguya salminicola]